MIDKQQQVNKKKGLFPPYVKNMLIKLSTISTISALIVLGFFGLHAGISVLSGAFVVIIGLTWIGRSLVTFDNYNMSSTAADMDAKHFNAKYSLWRRLSSPLMFTEDTILGLNFTIIFSISLLISS